MALRRFTGRFSLESQKAACSCNYRTVSFASGDFPKEESLADNDKIPLTWATPDGLYTYLTTLGAKSTVHAYKFTALVHFAY